MSRRDKIGYTKLYMSTLLMTIAQTLHGWLYQTLMRNADDDERRLSSELCTAG